MKKAAHPGALVCKHIKDLQTGDNISPICNVVLVEDMMDVSVFKLPIGTEILICDECKVAHNISRWREETRQRILAHDTDPKLTMLVAQNYMFSFTGSLFNNTDVVLVSKFVGVGAVATIFKYILDNVDVNNITEPKEVFVKNTGLRGMVGSCRVRVVPDTLPENHEFYDINTFGDIEKLKLVRIILPDSKNLLPGMDGYDETFDPKNNMTLKELFNG